MGAGVFLRRKRKIIKMITKIRIKDPIPINIRVSDRIVGKGYVLFFGSGVEILSSG